MDQHRHSWEPAVAEVLNMHDEVVRIVRIRFCLVCLSVRLPRYYGRGQLRRDLPIERTAQLRTYTFGKDLPLFLTYPISPN